jgi:hypothetical protein
MLKIMGFSLIILSYNEWCLIFYVMEQHIYNRKVDQCSGAKGIHQMGIEVKS